LIEHGELPFVKLGRRILIDRLDLDAWISQHKERFE
jgi:excisionase family DNA binding protein